MKTLARVEAEVTLDGKTSLSCGYYMACAVLTASPLAEAARAYRSIENSYHYVLDTTVGDERARARKDHRPENFAILRKFALNFLQTARKKVSIRRKPKRSG